MTPRRQTGVALAEAESLAEQLESIHRVLRAAAWEHARQLPDPLTAPQVETLKALVRRMREDGAGMSVSELSERLGLAHSTVSGIVDRLEARALVQRIPRPDDRRYVQIELTGPVQGWVTRELPDSRAARLRDALARATPKQRTAILAGVRELAGLLGDGPG